MQIIQNADYLIVEEHQEDYLALKQMLLALDIAEDRIQWKQYIFEIKDTTCDLIFGSLDLEFTGPDLITSIQSLAPDPPIIVLSRDKDLDRAIQAIQKGAQDYMVKGSFDQLQLFKAIQFAFERNELKVKLDKTKQELESLFQYNPIPLIVYNLNTLDIIRVNQAAIENYGFTEEEFKSLSLRSMRPEEEYALFDDKITKIRASRHFAPTILRHKRKNGDIIDVEVSVYTFNDESNTVIACLNDVSEEVKAKKALSVSNERFEYVLKATYDAIWDWDIKKNKLNWGENFQKIFGHKPGKLESNFEIWKNFVHPDDKEIVLQSLEAAINGQATDWIQGYRFQRKNGAYAYVEDKCLILRDEKGKAYRAIGAVQDISERKSKEQQLELMDSVVRNSNDAILITEGTPIDEPGPRIIYANEAFYKNTGYKEDEVIGRSPRFLQGPNTDRKALDIVRKAMEQGTSCQVELINYTKTGKEFWVEFSIVPVEYEGKTQFISIQRDVTERKEEESRNELFRRMNMEISKPSGLKGRFDIVLKALADHCEFELAEGWITNIDNSKLSRITTYSRDIELSGFFQDEMQFHKANKGEGLPGKLWANRDFIVWNDIQENKGFIRQADARKFELQSAVAIPIFYLDKLIGAILLFTRKNIKSLNGVQKVLNEVSHRFGAELLRMKSEEELNTFFNLSPDIFSIIDTKGNFKKVNPTFTQLLGYSQDEMEGLSIFDITQPKDLENATQIFENIIEGQQSNYLESRVLNKSGDLIWISLSFTYDHEEELIYTVAKDITEQKYLEKLLKKTNELAKIGSWEYDLLEDKLYWSDVTRQIHEVPEDFMPEVEEAVNFYDKEYIGKIKHLLNQSLMGDQPRWEAEAKLITHQGNEKWVHVEGNSEWQNGNCIRAYGSVQDIHERKLAEIKLYETNLRYQLATEATDIGIWDWDIVNNHVVLDDPIYELYGIKKGDFSGAYEELLEVIHPLDLERFDAKVKAALQSDTKLFLTYRVIHPDKSIHYLRAHAEIIKGDNGKPFRLIGINYDITNDIIQQEELAKAYKEREDILESITDGFFAVDHNWNVNYWNAAAEKMVSLPRTEIIGKNLWEVFADVRDDIFYEALHESRRENEMKNFDQYYPEADLWLEISTYPRKYGLAVYFKDITEQRKQEQKIIEMRNLQRHVINSTTDIIWAIDKNYKLVLGNQAYFDTMKAITGVEYKIGESVASYSDIKWNLKDASKKEWHEVYQRAFSGEKVSYKFTHESSDEEVRHFTIDIHPIKQEDGRGEEAITGLACFSKDMTKELNYIDAIEDQNERLREIAWLQSHVVRAPVARIMGLAKLILEDEEDITRINELLPHILESSEELDGIIHQITEKTEAIQMKENLNKTTD